jgi:hypothetical protein
VKRLSLIFLASLAFACGPPPEVIHAPPPAAVTAAPSASVSAAPSVSVDPVPAPTAIVSVAPTAPPPPAPPPIPPNTVVLSVGDSFLLAGFSQALKPKLLSLGVRYEVRSEQSSYTVTWAGKMELVVANTQPDLVIINLGANEMSNTDPPTHANAVRRIVKYIGDRPCVWVSPPSWRKDTGILDVIRQNTAPCRFFDSDEHVKEPIPRQSDKIHPNSEGGAIWAAAFWKWLQEERAPAEAPAEGATPAKKSSPWKLKPAPLEEHQPKAKPKE